jgi:uncharacterized membrane protein YagU involved in acid resistance
MRGKQGYASINFESVKRMATTVPLNWGRIVLSGILAGIAGGICIDLFIYLISLPSAHTSVLSLWQFIASAGFGRLASTSATHPWAGVATHFLVSIGWGIGYAYIAQTRPATNKNVLISGFVYGLVVYVVMQFVLYTVQALKTADALELYIGVLAYTVFFGVPISLVARVK